MPRFRRILGGALAAAAWWMVSCREIPTPPGGVHSISAIILPSPGVVAGDTLRDSLGLVAPLDLIAYGLDNEPLDPQPERSFVVLDTGAILGAGVYLIGETPGTSVRVVGSVGTLQTQPRIVKVTRAPEVIVAPDTTLDVTYTAIAPDSVANATLNVDVLHQSTAAAGVEARVVQFIVDRLPSGTTTDGSPAFVLLNGTRISTRDTTDANGRASLTGRLRVHKLTAFGVDTVMVSATSSYRGVSLGTVPFMIIYRHAPPTPAPSPNP